jgi:hypothetical protein
MEKSMSEPLYLYTLKVVYHYEELTAYHKELEKPRHEQRITSRMIDAHRCWDHQENADLYAYHNGKYYNVFETDSYYGTSLLDAYPLIKELVHQGDYYVTKQKIVPSVSLRSLSEEIRLLEKGQPVEEGW